MSNKVEAFKLRINGIVQGVGFRPFVKRCAAYNDISGWVLNSSGGILIWAEGNSEKLKGFYQKLIHNALFLPYITFKSKQKTKPKGIKGFEIRKSLKEEGKFTTISPDLAICDDCKSEFFDKRDKRYGYPFITCTSCGPRLTLLIDLPYDRKSTSMDSFSTCKSCFSEYKDISDRRFHSQTNSCSLCGPTYSLLDYTGNLIKCDIQKSPSKLLNDGAILAVKGIGGFHLVCDAKNKETVSLLRKKKNRTEKPFAIMVRDIKKVKDLAYVSKIEEKLLNSRSAPIVILKKRQNSSSLLGIAPFQKYLGIMLPYAPIHYMLFDSSEDLNCLVMTSANISGEPIISDNDEALFKLKNIADFFLISNRDIINKVDDSILFAFNGKKRLIRRARGFVPVPFKTNFKLKNILATGSDLKNTFSLTKDNFIFPSSHIGDLKYYNSFNLFSSSIDDMKRIMGTSFDIVAYDMHPDMLSSKFAKKLISSEGITGVAVLHHHAHAVSCMIDNKVKYDEKVICVLMDGTGVGTDGNVWGGEYAVCDYKEFKRFGSLKNISMPGGEACIKEPSRMAVSYLYSVFGNEIFNLDIDILKRVPPSNLKFLVNMIEKKINSPLTSSAGRLFDAVSSLLRLCDKVSFDAEAAIKLEMAANEKISTFYNYEVLYDDDILRIIPDQIIKEIIRDINFMQKT